MISNQPWKTIWSYINFLTSYSQRFFCLELLLKVDRHEILHLLMYKMTQFGKTYFFPVTLGGAKRGRERCYIGRPYFLVCFFIIAGLATFWKVSKKLISNIPLYLYRLHLTIFLEKKITLLHLDKIWKPMLLVRN